MFWSKKKPSETLHHELYALLLSEEFKRVARDAPDEQAFMMETLAKKFPGLVFEGIEPAHGMGVGMRRVRWHLVEAPSEPYFTPYYL